jgi:tRNA (guanosine-2'-O-)-methyltransferase|nr:RNA methyltransferase [Kofleriaceae bacterium]
MTDDMIDGLVDRYGAEAMCTALEPMLSPARIARIDVVLAARLGSVVPVLEDTYDAHNAAATIRTIEAIGLQDLHVVELAHPFVAVHAISRGAHDWIDLHRHASADAAVAALHARGFRVLATAPDAPNDLESVDVSTPVAVMFGNEHAGLSDAAMRAADAAIAVPMHGMTESFNLSVTVALVTSRLAARRRAHLGVTGDLDPARIARLRARWFGARVRGLAGVLERVMPAGA